MRVRSKKGGLYRGTYLYWTYMWVPPPPPPGISSLPTVPSAPTLLRSEPPFYVVMRATGEYTTRCVVGDPLTPYKHCHMGSAHLVRTEVIHLLNSTRPQAQAVTHPCTNRNQYCLTCRIWLCAACTMPSHHWPYRTSWVIIYYMSHTIDKWNLYWSYTIKCIFAGIIISRFDPH